MTGREAERGREGGETGAELLGERGCGRRRGGRGGSSRVEALSALMSRSGRAKALRTLWSEQRHVLRLPTCSFHPWIGSSYNNSTTTELRQQLQLRLGFTYLLSVGYVPC